VQTALDLGAHGEAGPAGEIRRGSDCSGQEVNNSGDSDANAQEFSSSMFLGELLDRGAHVVDNAVAAERELGPDVNSFQRSAVFVHSSNAKVGAA
jgi:hypothetical protein